jgi:hypothetical protein
VYDDSGAMRNVVKPLPAGRPDIPSSRDPKQAMLLRLAAMELTSGFPHALDPTYARRTLALGDEGYKAVLECTKSKHTFLSRNAVVVLAQYPHPEASDELRKIWRGTDDRITQVRAAMGLIRRREKAIVPDLIQDVKCGGMIASTIAVYGLGMIGDPSGAKAVADLIAAGPGELGSTAVPALGRMRAGKETLLAYEAALRGRFEGTDMVTSEGPGTSSRILRQMCVLALAMNGEKAFLDEMHARVSAMGLAAFHPATHYLLIEALACTEAGAKLLREKVLESPAEDAFRVEGLRALAANKRLEPEYLQSRALDGLRGDASRALALELLAEKDEKLARAACTEIVDDYASARRTCPGLVVAAAQIGGRRGWIDARILLGAAERARTTGAVGRREANDDPDITRAEVRIHPPLLETLLVELGRTRAVEAVPLLQRVLDDLKTPQGRAEAVLALGAIEGAESSRLVARALDDRDGWVRYCAYQAAAARTGHDYFCNWIFGSDADRNACATMYRAAMR